MSREFKIGVLAGDGIGPEVSDATAAVLTAAAQHCGLAVRLTLALVGWKAREKFGNLLPDETLAMLREADGWIMGPTFAGEYPKDDHTKGHPSGYLRRTFNLFANVRPVQAWRQQAAHSPSRQPSASRRSPPIPSTHASPRSTPPHARCPSPSPTARRSPAA